jgi:alkylation response protein AidB-like acyl-CoA dehydrogenase
MQYNPTELYWRDIKDAEPLSREKEIELFQLAKAGDPQAEKTKAMARVFAGEVAQVVGENALKIATGTGVTEPPAMEQFLADIGYQELLGSRCNWVVDMDKIADIILER